MINLFFCSQMNKLIFLGLMPVLMLMVPNVSASANQEELSEKERESGFYYTESGSPKHTKDRPAINPDFAPDQDCNLAYELKCIPGSQQSCFDLEGFENGEDNVCSPEQCQEGYHEEEDNESGLCYPDDEGCRTDDYVLIERDDGEMFCAYFSSICGYDEHAKEDYCIEWREENGVSQIAIVSTGFTGEEIIYDKNADLPICVYKEIKDCKTRSGLICEVETTIDPCQDIFHGFTGTDENYKPETNQFIVPADVNSDDTINK